MNVFTVIGLACHLVPRFPAIDLQSSRQLPGAYLVGWEAKGTWKLRVPLCPVHLGESWTRSYSGAAGSQDPSCLRK